MRSAIEAKSGRHQFGLIRVDGRLNNLSIIETRESLFMFVLFNDCEKRARKERNQNRNLKRTRNKNMNSCFYSLVSFFSFEQTKQLETKNFEPIIIILFFPFFSRFFPWNFSIFLGNFKEIITKFHGNLRKLGPKYGDLNVLIQR